MSSPATCEIVQRAASAFAVGDAATLRESLAPDVEQVVPGTGALAGTHKGVAEVLALYARLAEISGGTLRIQVRHLVTDGGDRVIMTYHAAARRYGQVFDSESAMVCTITDGRISRMEGFLTDVVAHDQFWG